jgi:hypothetical protein
MTARKLWIAGLLCALMDSSPAAAASPPAGEPPPVPATLVTDYVHAVIEAHRTFYTMHVVERLQNKGVAKATENWRVANTLPLPAQFLLESSELAGRTGSLVRFKLISAWPVNPANAPESDLEKAGMQAVIDKPERPHTGLVGEGADRRFVAIYADRAVTKACIGCHNGHPTSPKRDFKVGDVMGAMVISIPSP